MACWLLVCWVQSWDAVSAAFTAVLLHLPHHHTVPGGVVHSAMLLYSPMTTLGVIPTAPRVVVGMLVGMLVEQAA